jgi:hypothetical protein
MIENLRLNDKMNKIIILRIYSDSRESMILNNTKFSQLFKFFRGVKQGGVLSGSLFNVFK